MKRTLFTLTAVLAIVAGCAKDNFGSAPETHSGIKQITACLDEPTKTYISEDEGVYKLFWMDEECVLVGAGDQFPQFILTEGANSPKGKFESYEDLPVSSTYYAASPESTLPQSSNDTLYVTYPNQLYYDAYTSSATGGEIMVARSATTDFAFRNAIGYIKFNLSVTESEQISKIEISGKDGGRVAGRAAITFDEDRIDTVKFLSGAETAIEIDFADPVAITTETPFTILIPVAPMAKGVSICATMASGKSMTMTSSTGVHIGEIVDLPVVEFNPVTVAKIGETYYYSLKQAFEAAAGLDKDATIEIIADCNAGADCELISTNVITLDLNGHTVYGVGDNCITTGTGTKEVIIIDSSEEKTGKIANRNSGSAPIKIFGHTVMKSGTIAGDKGYGVYVQGGSFIMEGGQITSNSHGLYCKAATDKKIDSVLVAGDSKIQVANGCGAYINSKDADLIFRGGEVLCTTKNVGVYCYDGNLKIYDGTFGAPYNVIATGRGYANQIDIYGGKFHRDGSSASIVFGFDKDTTRVWGGYFTSAVSSNLIPEGLFATSCDTVIDGRQYVVTIAKAAAVQATVSIDGGEPIEKATVNEAFNTAVESGKDALITLVTDCAPTDSMVLKTANKITVDFNGKTLTCTNDKIFRVVGENSDITFKTSVPGGGIDQKSSGTGCMAIRQRGGKVTIESGVYSGTGIQYTFYTTGGEFHMNGGEAYADSNAIWISRGKFYMNGGKFIHRETSKYETIKQIYITTDGEGVFTGGEFESVYVYDSNTKATFTGGNYKSFTLSGGCKEIYIEDGTYQNIKFNPTGTITVKGGTFNGRSYMDGTGTLNIEGGTFTNESSSYGYAMWPTAGKVNIKNATFTGNTSYGTLRFTKCSATLNEGTVVNSLSKDGNAIYVGSDDYKGTVVINGGTYTSPKAIYASNGVLTVNDGIFNCSGIRVLYSTTSVEAQVLGGYFNTTADSCKVEGKGLAGVLKGGWYNKPVTEAAVGSGFIADNSKSTTKEGITYNYHIVENTASDDIATVNGVGYKSIINAIKAAKEYSGADEEVTLKLVSPQDTVELTANSDFTNANGKPVKLDLNNHILKGTVDSLILTKGVLTLTDESEQKGGVITTARRKIICLEKAGTVNIKHIKIDGTRGAMGYPGLTFSLITVNGTSTENKAVINVSDGARILAKSYYVKIFYVTYGSLNLENCELITKYGSTSDYGSYPCVWVYSGGKVHVKSGTYMQANGLCTRGALWVATGNTSVGSEIVVEDGTYFYCDGVNGAIASDESGGVPYASKTLLLNGGYMNAFKTEYLPKYGTGLSLQTISPAKEYTNCLGETKSFGYQVK